MELHPPPSPTTLSQAPHLPSPPSLFALPDLNDSSDDYPSTTNPAASTTSDVTENADIGTTVTNPNNEMAYADGLIIEDGGGLEAATLAPTSP